MSRTTQRERDTYRDFADKSGGDFSDIIHDLCRDADRLAQAEAMLRELGEYFDNYADVTDSDRGVAEVPNESMEWLSRISAFLSDGSE